MAVGILLYDDNVGLRESLEQLIRCSDDFLLLGSFPDPSQVEQQVKDIGPDVILMDIDMPHRTGIEAVQIIRRFNANVAIIMLTVFEDNRHVLDAICAGASGYLLKKHISDKLTDAIKDVLQGGAPMSPGIARMVIESLHKLPASEENKYQLTPREKEILNSLAKGNSFKMIGSDLSISIDTVRTHIKRIYEKLQVHSQVEAVSKAMHERLI